MKEGWKEFEDAGLHMDKERVLTYSKLSCPLDCRYCFVDDLNQQQQRHVSYLSETQLDLIDHLPPEITLIMLGCDTEFFQSKENSLEILKKLTDANRDISVITKLALPPKFIEELSLIRSELEDRGNLFSFSVSIPCFESANFWEPKAPRPEKRIETLESAFANGFKTLVALRPLLPTVADPELAHIISSTKDISHGYYSGPLYLKNLDESLISYEALGKLNVEKLQPHWMPAGNDFYKIERPRQMEYLNSIVNQSGKRLFEGAADAIQFLKNEKY